MTHPTVKAVVSRYRKSVKIDTVKPCTIDIPTEPVELRVSTPAEPRKAAQTGKAQSSIVGELSDEDKQSEKKAEALADFPLGNHSHDITPAANSGDYPPKKQAEMEMQSLFEVGHPICLTGFGHQDNKWVGEIAEVKEATATEIEVVIKVSLQPSIDD